MSSKEIIIKSLGYSNYRAYTSSEDFKSRTQHLKKDECFCCGKKDGLYLHHTTYENLGKELDTDLVTVCAGCHRTIHNIVNKDADLEDAHFIVRRFKRQKGKGRRAKCSICNEKKLCKRNLKEYGMVCEECMLWFSDSGLSEIKTTRKKQKKKKRKRTRYKKPEGDKIPTFFIRDEYVQGLGYKDFADYEQSHGFQTFSDENISKKCFCCRTKDNLVVHHKTYKNLGQEQPEDVVTVCRDCQEKIHKLVVTRKSKLKYGHLKIRKPRD